MQRGALQGDKYTQRLKNRARALQRQEMKKRLRWFVFTGSVTCSGKFKVRWVYTGTNHKQLVAK